jgi:hypothetical protein
MNEKYVVALLANVARIKADDRAAMDLKDLETDARFPASSSVRRGRAALHKVIDEQVARLKREGGLLFLNWSM